MGRKKGIDWDKVTDLGTTWDSDIALRTGKRIETVSKARSRKGIPPYRPAAICSICGTTFNVRKRAQFTCGKECCTSKLQTVREFYNLTQGQELDPNFLFAYLQISNVEVKYLGTGVPLGIDWDSTPLGILKDADIARLYACSHTTVAAARLRRNIPAVSHAVDWDTVEDLGKVPDRVIAKRYNRSKSSVSAARRKRSIPAVSMSYIVWDSVTDLGKVPDSIIAGRYNCSPHSVSNARKVRKIPPYQLKRMQWKRIKWGSIKNLGLIPDSVIARRLGCSVSSVYLKRKALGITSNLQREVNKAKGENNGSQENQ